MQRKTPDVWPDPSSRLPQAHSRLAMAQQLAAEHPERVEQITEWLEAALDDAAEGR
jgi:hypothetical protein